MRAIIVDAFRPLTAAQVIERLDAAQIANARMNDMKEVWAHPQLAARKRWVDVDTPAGRVPAPLPPGVPPSPSPRMDAVPALGQHTAAILRELGYSDADIARLRAAKGHLMPNTDAHPTATLARFASELRFDDIPAAVVRRAEDLLLDWIGSALAGKGRAPRRVDRAVRIADGAGRRRLARC